MTVELVGDRLREAERFRSIVLNAEMAPLLAHSALIATEVSSDSDGNEAAQLGQAS